jgi:RHS repeat-associated protein
LVLADEIAGCLSNADGLRVGKETPSDARKFIYDFRKLLQETDGADDPQRWYTFTSEEYGDLISQYDGSDTLYHQYDGLGSTDALLDEWETATDRYAYRAFGLEAARSGTTDNPFTYVGRHGYYKDPELELYLLGARYYDPALGRFLSEDPIGFEAGDANLLRYVENGPTNFMDPSGLEPPRAVRPLQQYLAARNAELNESLWNLANPLKGSFLPWYLIGSTYHALAAAPGSVREGFAEGQARVNERHSRAEDTVATRASYAFQMATLYAGEGIAHGGVRLGQIGMASYAAAHGGPVGPALMHYKPVQTLGLIGTGSGAVFTTGNIVADLSQGNGPDPGDLVDLGIFGGTSLRFKQQLTTAPGSGASTATTQSTLGRFLDAGRNKFAFFRRVDTPAGPVRISSKSVKIEGKTITIDDVEIFPDLGGKVDLGTSGTRQMLQSVADEIGTQGFTKVVIRGKRITGAKVANDAADRIQTFRLTPRAGSQ